MKPTRTESTSKSTGTQRLAAAAVFLLTALVYGRTFGAQFVSFDDDANFVNNAAFRGLGPSQLHWMWTTTLLGHYVPLSWMSLGLDYELWGMNAAGYHAVNVLLHAASAVLVFVLARRVFALCCLASDSSREAIFGAVFAALVFAVHPLRVQSVAWVTERRDALSLVLGLGSVIMYLRAVEREELLRKRYIASVALFVCALLSKATVVAIPAVLFVLSVYPLRTVGGTAGWTSSMAKRTYVRLAPFAALALLFGVGSVVALHPGSQLPLASKLAVVGYGVVFYFLRMIAPLRLSPMNIMPASVDPFAFPYNVCMLATLTLLAALWFGRRRLPGLTAAMTIYLVVLLPLLGVVQNGNELTADRYTYHASPALAIAAGAGILALIRARRSAALVFGSVVVVVLSALTWAQTTVWHDSVRLWTRVLEIDSTNAFAHNNLGVELAAAGNTREAIQHYVAAIALRPGYAHPHNNLGFEAEHLGAMSEAEGEYRKAIALEPNYAEAELNLGNVLLARGAVDEGVEHYQRATVLAPGFAGAHYDLGIALLRQRRFDEAAQQLGVAVKLDPGDREAREALESARARR